MDTVAAASAVPTFEKTEQVVEEREELQKKRF